MNLYKGDSLHSGNPQHCRESPLYFGALGSVGPTPIHPELGSEKAERI